MARCKIGAKKLRTKIQPLMPSGWIAVQALVRGGWRHGDAQVLAIDPSGEKIVGAVNYIVGEPFEAETGTLSHWC